MHIAQSRLQIIKSVNCFLEIKSILFDIYCISKFDFTISFRTNNVF